MAEELDIEQMSAEGHVSTSEPAIPADIQKLVDTLESLKDKADLLEEVSNAVDLGRKAHDKATRTFSVDDALSILDVLGIIAGQQRPNLEPSAPDELKGPALEILLEVCEAHKRLLSYINK